MSRPNNLKPMRTLILAAALTTLLLMVSGFVVADHKGKPHGGPGGGGDGGGDGGGGLRNPAFVAPGDKGLFLITSSGATQQLTRTKGMESDVRAIWSPSGNWIAFLRHPDNRYVDQDLYTIRPDGTGLTWIRSFRFGDDPIPNTLEHGLVWTPDGSGLLFPEEISGKIWFVGLDGTLHLVFDLTADMNDGNAWRLDDQLTFSPDFSDESGYQGFLTFMGHSTVGGGKADIYSLDVVIDDAARLTTGDLTNMTSTPDTHEESPAWNPTGGFLLYERYNDANRSWDAVLLELASGIEAVVLTLGRDTVYTWSPGGNYVGFTDSSDGSLFYFTPWDPSQPVAFVAKSYGTPDWNTLWQDDT